MIQKKQLPQVIFREYDIRGKMGQDLTIDAIYDLGRSLAYFFKQKNTEIKTVALGMDGRIHSPALKEQLVQAFLDSGLNVHFIGLCHSPALYFAMHNLPVEAGVMITASHNPKEYNGLKMCLGKESIWGVDIQELYKCYKQEKKLTAERQGSYTEQDIIPMYVDWLADHFSDLKGMKLPCVIDCGNGAAGAVVPSLIKKMAWSNVQALYTEVDGTYPHHDANPVDIKNMMDVKRLLETTSAEVGIGLDGDADRMAPMTKSGILVSGDLLLGLFAQAVVEEHADVSVTFDVKASKVLIDYLTSIGAKPIMSPTGHSIVKDTMKKHGALLAGELSCHFFFKDRYFGYDDGIYAMMRLFQLMEQTGKSLDELLAVYATMHTSPEYRIACKEEEKQSIVQTVKDVFVQRNNAELLTIDGVRVTTPCGWGLLRASNTQPALSMRFEAHTEQDLVRIKQDFIEALAPFFEEAYLKETFK